MKYSNLSIYHKRKIVAANRIGNIALSYIAQQGNNQLVRMIQRNALSYAYNLSDEEVEKEIKELDQLIEEAKTKTARVNMGFKKTRSLKRL